MENSIAVTKEQLKNIDIAIDTNNPKYELNYCYIDNTNIVATNTKCLIIVKHQEYIDKPFYISKQVVKRALKERSATSFTLSDMTITALDNKDREIISISKEDNTSRFKYPEYNGITNIDKNETILFTDNYQIGGILSLKKIAVDPTNLPKINQGVIHIESKNKPLIIENTDEKILFCIMPIVDRFEELEEYLYK